MSELQGQGGELRCTVTITRKATGKTETVELIGRTTPEQHAAIMHGASGAIIGRGAALSNKTKES